MPTKTTWLNIPVFSFHNDFVKDSKSRASEIKFRILSKIDLRA